MRKPIAGWKRSRRFMLICVFVYVISQVLWHWGNRVPPFLSSPDQQAIVGVIAFGMYILGCPSLIAYLACGAYILINASTVAPRWIGPLLGIFGLVSALSVPYFLLRLLSMVGKTPLPSSQYIEWVVLYTLPAIITIVLFSGLIIDAAEMPNEASASPNDKEAYSRDSA
ncbi:MAG: hypothetical protein HY318_11150 [Armatimonadetes bacterium]|nr:hypothetical protein [Armatimonadota bacterium]